MCGYKEDASGPVALQKGRGAPLMPQAASLDKMDGNGVQGRQVVRENKDMRWEITESVFF